MNRLTDPQKRAIIRDYLAGVKEASIAARWRIDPTYPRKLATAAGKLPPRRPGPPKVVNPEATK